MFRKTAHAKINLALHVTDKLESGYHALDSLVVFTEFGDRIFLNESHVDKPHVSLEISGPFRDEVSDDENNLVCQAAIALAEVAALNDVETRSVHIELEKNLPISSGIGGGSADAAAALLLLKEFWRLGDNIDLHALAYDLGADVPMCLHSKPLRAQGIGDIITELNLPGHKALLLVNPMVEVPTPQIFAQLKKTDNPPIQLRDQETFPSFDELTNMRNDLQEAAVRVQPIISGVLQELEKAGSQLSRMSGSGATCFGLFPTLEEAEKARGLISRIHSEWWCVATLCQK